MHALILALALALACSPRVAADGQRHSTASTLKQTRASRAEAESVPSERGAPREGSDTASAGSAKIASFDVNFARELEAEVTHLALDRPPHMAALGRAALFVHDKRGWRTEALPAALRDDANLNLKVFFGRDYRVRLVGTRTLAPGTQTQQAESVYLRGLPGGLRAAPEELGRLGGRQGALLAVLGTADPEIVCRPNEICLIKRLSGWAQLPAAGDLSHVAIADGQGFALIGKRVFRAEQLWQAVGPEGPFQDAGGLFVVGERIFVLEPAQGLIHVLSGNAWQSSKSPVAVPRALYGAGPNDVFLVGDGGLSHYDGHEWRLAQGSPPGLTTILGRNAADVWVGGVSGLYRVERPST